VRHKEGDGVICSRQDDPREIKELVIDPNPAPIKTSLAAMTDAWRDQTGDAAPWTAQTRTLPLGRGQPSCA